MSLDASPVVDEADDDEEYDQDDLDDGETVLRFSYERPNVSICGYPSVRCR